MKKIIAIIGRAGSGKDAAGEYISRKIGVPVYQISGALRIIASEKNIPETRENLIAIGKQVANDFGDEYLAKKILENSDGDYIIITGMRQIGQLEYCKKKADVLFIGIESAQEIRYERLVENGKVQGSYHDFLEVERLDEGSLQNVGKCLEYCNIIIENNTTIKAFEEKLFPITQRFLGKNLKI